MDRTEANQTTTSANRRTDDVDARTKRIKYAREKYGVNYPIQSQEIKNRWRRNRGE